MFPPVRNTYLRQVTGLPIDGNNIFITRRRKVSRPNAANDQGRQHIRMPRFSLAFEIYGNNGTPAHPKNPAHGLSAGEYLEGG